MDNLHDIDLIELNEAYQKVLYWFFSFPDMETGLSDLAEDVAISKTTAKRVVEELIAEGFLERKVYGKAWRIKCNRKHHYNFSKKIAFNLAMVFEAYESGLREHILKIVGDAKAVVLFGSYRKGDDTEKSDVDIAVEVGDGDFRVAELGIIPNFGYRENISVNLHIFCRKKVDINLYANILNGIVLEGFLEP
jgi:predicted nucleotidyltransferase